MALSFTLLVFTAIASTSALMDIAQNVCQFGDNELKCFMRTLEADIEADALAELASLSVVCSDAFFYESTLRARHFGELPDLESLSLDYCKMRHMPGQAFAGLYGLKTLSVNSHNSEWSSLLMDMDKDAFAGLDNLLSLNLAFNNMWSLPINTLCAMPRLQSLNLSTNHLLDITDLGLGLPSSESNCKFSLEEVDLSKNFIASLRSNDLSQISSTVKRLNLRANRLTYVSDEALYDLPSLQMLNLADNQLAALPPAVFNKSLQLAELHLQNNSLTLVTPELFGGLTNLVHLNLSYNAISSHLLSSDTFGGLVSLKVLDLSFNRISKISPDLFARLQFLELLKLDHNMVVTIDGLHGVTRLRSLSLANNKLRDVNNLDNLRNLTSLDLQGNELSSVSSFMSALISLEDVFLSRNLLTSVPHFANKLKTLDLGENRIESIEDGAFSSLADSLYALRLAGNAISALSNQTFGNMTGLHVLNLANNRLAALPQATFKGLSQLRGLRLDNNGLADLNGIVASLGKLQWLNVSNNALEWFDYAFIPNSLEWLDISRNEVGELGNFYHLQNFNLHTLEAGHNRISILDESSFPAQRLQFVQLQHNSITKVEPHTFAQLAYLDSVDLRFNQIRSLSKESLRKSIQVAKATPPSRRPQVLLHANPLVCDCHLEWLPSINSKLDDEDDDDHVRVADLAELECQLNQDFVLVSQVPEGGFLCSYTTHCFDLCRCCEFYACDCRMQCPSGCTCQHDVTWSRNIITCSNDNQTDMPLLIPMDATKVALDGNNFGHIGQQHFLGRQRIQELHLNNSGIRTIGAQAFSGMTGLKMLDLSQNAQLRELHGQEFAGGLGSLRELRLDHCGLVYINDLTFQPLEALRTLRLDGNLLTSFPVWRLAHVTSLTLAQNVWSCECEFIAPFNDFLEANIEAILDYEQIQCVSENAVTATSSKTICRTKASPPSNYAKIEVNESNLELAGILIPALLSASVLLLGVLAIFVFKNHIKSWLYAKSSEVYESRYNSSLGGMSTSAASEAKLFDVYVSYAKADADFVDHNLAPTLEHGPRATYRLCMHHRDFPLEAGSSLESVYNTVSVASESSAKILIVLSKAYLANEWPTVKTAVLDGLRKQPHHYGESRLILLAIEDISSAPELKTSGLLPHFLNGPTVRWGSAGFINKLRFFLPEPVHTTFQRTVTLRSVAAAGGAAGAQIYGQSEHLYHYIAENSPVYHSLEQPPLKMGAAVTNPTFIFNVENHPNHPKNFCHSHSLSTSSGQRLLTSPEEYIV